MRPRDVLLSRCPSPSTDSSTAMQYNRFSRGLISDSAEQLVRQSQQAYSNNREHDQQGLNAEVCSNRHEEEIMTLHQRQH
eukprot:4466351-Amphidinium_carterae.1